MKNASTYFISACMVLVFALYLVPHEIVHVFYDHHDTEHSEADHGSQKTLSAIHIHCDFLSTDLTDFLAPEHTAPAECSVEIPFHHAVLHVQTVRCIAVLRESRGPPAI